MILWRQNKEPSGVERRRTYLLRDSRPYAAGKDSGFNTVNNYPRIAVPDGVDPQRLAGFSVDGG